MHHATTSFHNVLQKSFATPAVTLRNVLQRSCSSFQLSCRAGTTQARSFNSHGLTSIPNRLCQTGASQHGRMISIQSRSYTSRPGEYGNMSEKDFQKHSQKFQQLSLHEVRDILGQTMSKKKGNDILSRLQKRRVTGTLDHEGQAPSADTDTVEQALTWLRKTYPLDEDAAIVKRIEREESENEKKFIEEAERLKTWHPQQSAEKDGIYGKPVVDEFAKAWNARQAAKIKERAERKQQLAELRANYEAQRLTDGRNSPAAEIATAESKAVYTGEGETAEWIKRYKEKGKLSDALEPPIMSMFERLSPSFILGAIVMAFCAYAIDVYQAPPAEYRFFPDYPVSVCTLQTITTANILVFLMWRVPPLWRMMNRNFMHIVGWPSARTTVLASFSHQSIAHLGANMLGLWLLGLPLHEEVGRAAFLGIFFTSAVCGALFTLTRFVWIGNLHASTLGASGAVTGVWAAWAWLPTRKREENDEKGDSFKTIGAWLGRPDLDDYSTWFWRGLLILLILGEWRVRKLRINEVDHWGHFGGYFGGIISSEWLLWHARRRKWLEENPKWKQPKPPLKPQFVKLKE